METATHEKVLIDNNLLFLSKKVEMKSETDPVVCIVRVCGALVVLYVCNLSCWMCVNLW